MAVGYRAASRKMGDYPSSVVSKIDLRSVTERGSRAWVTLTDESEMSFSADSKRSATEGDMTDHKVILKLIDGKWLVVADAYSSDGVEYYLRAAAAPRAMIAAAHKQSEAEMKARLKAQAGLGESK